MGFGQDIRSIARTKEIEEKADRALKSAIEAQNKAAIAGQRMIAWISAGGGANAVSGLEKGIPGITALTQGAIDAAKQALRDLNNPQDFDPSLDSLKTTIGGTDMSNSAYIQDAAVKSAKSLLDNVGPNDANGDRSESQIDPSEPGDAANRLQGISAFDYVNNDAVIFNMNGMYRLPDGWEDENTPPEYEHFVLGKFYRVLADPGDGNPITDSDAAVPELAARDWVDRANTNPIPVGSKPWAYNGITNVTLTGWTFEVIDATNTTFALNGSVETCTGSEGIIICPASAPSAASVWPTIGNGILAWLDGKWTPHQYDSEIPPVYQTPQSVIRFSMGGGRYGIMLPARTGGHLLYELDGSVTTDNPKPGSFGLLFRSDGTLSKYIEENSLSLYKLNL